MCHKGVTLMGSKNERDELQKELHKEQIIQLKAQRLSFRDIGKKLKVSHETVRRDYEEIKEEWANRNVALFNIEIQKDLVAIDLLIGKAFQGYERRLKKQVIVKTGTKTGEGIKGPIDMTEESTTTKRLIGDPRFLTEIRGLISLRHELMGTNHHVLKQIAEADNKGIEQIEHRQVVYIPGLDLTLTPEIIQKHPKLWEVLNDILQNQDAFSWSADNGPAANSQ